MAYEPTIFVAGQAPAYDSVQELMKVQKGIYDAHYYGVPVVGTYTGDGAASRVINLGFRPKAVYVSRSDGSVLTMISYNMNTYGGLALDGSPVYTDNSEVVGNVVNIVDGGFEVYNRAVTQTYTYAVRSNLNGNKFHYIAWR